MRSKEIDLRNIPASCSSHPIIELQNMVRSLIGEDVEVIRILFRVEDMPENIVRLLLSRYGYVVEESRKLDNGSLMLVARRQVEE